MDYKTSSQTTLDDMLAVASELKAKYGPRKLTPDEKAAILAHPERDKIIRILLQQQAALDESALFSMFVPISITPPPLERERIPIWMTNMSLFPMRAQPQIRFEGISYSVPCLPSRCDEWQERYVEHMLARVMGD